jgi:hypothetical protein
MSEAMGRHKRDDTVAQRGSGKVGLVPMRRASPASCTVKVSHQDENAKEMVARPIGCIARLRHS